MKRRLWINRFACGKYCKTDRQSIMVDTCAICRLTMSSTCIDCICSVDNNIIESYKDHARYIWTFLLVQRNRNDSPFNVFDLNVISRIYKYCIEGDYTSNNDCTIVVLQCDHVYHKHCFEKWIHRRLCCPLCNGSTIMPKSLKHFKYSVIDGSLVKIQQSYYDADTFYQMQDDSVSIQSVICKLLKHHKPGYSKEILYKRSLDYFPRNVDEEFFDKAIKYLVSRHYITFKPHDETYQYVP